MTLPTPRRAAQPTLVRHLLAWALGALGAVFIIFAFRNGGTPAYVMPIVFGLAILVKMLWHVANLVGYSTPTTLPAKLCRNWLIKTFVMIFV